MEIIYIDYLFFLNLVIDYFILLLTAKVCAAPFKRMRFLAAAALGGAYSALLVLPQFAFLGLWPMKIALSVAMVLISFGSERRLLRATLFFYAVSAAFGGAVFAASMLGGVKVDRAPFVPVTMRVLVLAFAVCYAAVLVVFQRSGLRLERSLMCAEITLLGRCVSIRAMRDTGNNLRDPVTGASVMVAETDAVFALFPDEIVEILKGKAEPARLFEVVMGVESTRGRFRLVPYTSVGVCGGLLLAFRPDELRLDGRRRRDIVVALSPTKMCDDGEYSAVL